MYQPKVQNTQKYEDSQGSHIVTTGKLILLHPPYNFESDTNIHYGEDIMCRPILISENEEIKKGDKVLSESGMGPYTVKEIIDNGPHTNKHVRFENGKVGNLFSYNKILALPEHFSDKHLQAIVDGKMKDGDEVLVRCDKYIDQITRIYLDQYNHITLFPAKQSLEEAAMEYCPKRPQYSRSNQDKNRRIRKAFKAGAEWAKKNNY